MLPRDLLNVSLRKVDSWPVGNVPALALGAFATREVITWAMVGRPGHVDSMVLSTPFSRECVCECVYTCIHTCAYLHTYADACVLVEVRGLAILQISSPILKHSLSTSSKIDLG